MPIPPVEREKQIAALCGQLFADPARVVRTMSHPVDALFQIAAHSHADLLQFDLLVSCGGEVITSKGRQAIHKTVAFVSYPGVAHGYELVPESESARVYHVQIRVGGEAAGEAEAEASGVKRGVFSELVCGRGAMPALESALRAVVRLGAVQNRRSGLMIARLAEVLYLWPTERGEGEKESGLAGQGVGDRGLGETIDLIESRLNDPPCLEEMAAVAHFSPRHFSRRFAHVYGCSPHAYITARRLAWSKQLLSQQRLTIGEVADATGFSSLATFSRWFSQHAGRGPRDFRTDPTLF